MRLAPLPRFLRCAQFCGHPYPPVLQIPYLPTDAHSAGILRWNCDRQSWPKSRHRSQRRPDASGMYVCTYLKVLRRKKRAAPPMVGRESSSNEELGQEDAPNTAIGWCRGCFLCFECNESGMRHSGRAAMPLSGVEEVTSTAAQHFIDRRSYQLSHFLFCSVIRTSQRLLRSRGPALFYPWGYILEERNERPPDLPPPSKP